MTSHIQLNAIKQGVWVDTLLPSIKEKIATFFLLYNAPTLSINITNQSVQRLALIYGLSKKGKRNKQAILQTQLKTTTFFDPVFHKDDFYPLLTGLLKFHYHTISIDWKDSIEVSKVINYEMNIGGNFFLQNKSFIGAPQI